MNIIEMKISVNVGHPVQVDERKIGYPQYKYLATFNPLVIFAMYHRRDDRSNTQRSNYGVYQIRRDPLVISVVILFTHNDICSLN